jgi:hypothetical protein
MTDLPSLADFAKEQVANRATSWADALPEEIQRQVVEAEVSVRTVVAWLHSIGYEEATDSRIDNWRRKRRAERARGKP